MPTIVDTAGAANANSFISRAAASTYLDARLNSSAWSAATDDNKDRALIEATRTLSLLDYIGARVDDVQALSWPRQEAVNPDSPDETEFDTDEIPQRVKDATCELALEFLKAGSTDLEGTDPDAALIRKKVGPLEKEFAEPGARPSGIARFKRVSELVEPLLESDDDVVVRC